MAANDGIGFGVVGVPRDGSVAKQTRFATGVAVGIQDVAILVRLNDPAVWPIGHRGGNGGVAVIWIDCLEITTTAEWRYQIRLGVTPLDCKAGDIRIERHERGITIDYVLASTNGLASSRDVAVRPHPIATTRNDERIVEHLECLGHTIPAGRYRGAEKTGDCQRRRCRCECLLANGMLLARHDALPYLQEAYR